MCTLAFAFTKLNETWIKLNQLIVSEINTEKISLIVLIDKIYLHFHSCATSRVNLNVFAKVLLSDNNDLENITFGEGGMTSSLSVSSSSRVSLIVWSWRNINSYTNKRKTSSTNARYAKVCKKDSGHWSDIITLSGSYHRKSLKLRRQKLT